MAQLEVMQDLQKRLAQYEQAYEDIILYSSDPENEEFAELKKKFGKYTDIEAQTVRLEGLVAKYKEKVNKEKKKYEGSCMQPVLFGMNPSKQVSSAAMDREEAKEAFLTSVDEIESVVEDATILHSLLIARGNVALTGLPANVQNNIDSICARLHSVSSGDYHESAPQSLPSRRPNKLARLSACAPDADKKACEDTRSMLFAMAWNMAVNDNVRVLATPQVVTKKNKKKTSTADIVLSSYDVDAMNPQNNTPRGYNIVIEWKCNITEGADREGSVHAMHLKDAGNGNKFLVLSVATGQVDVFGFYWREGDDKAKKVKIAKFATLQECLKAWLPALIWFAKNADDMKSPEYPRLSLQATNSKLLKVDLYMVEMDGLTWVYKVFDYINRQTKPAEDRRWLNWDLVEIYYPRGTQLIASGGDLDIFACPFIEAAELHLPKSKDQFLIIGEKLASMHKGENRTGKEFIHGDVRLANMFFPEDVNEAYPTDFDFARPWDSANPPTYVKGYKVDQLPRHPDAKPEGSMAKSHDIQSYWECFKQVFVPKDGNNFDDNRNWETMDDLVCHIRDLTVERKGVKSSDIPELNVYMVSPK